MSTHAEAFARARALHQSGDRRRAEDAYRALLRAEPRDARVWAALAQLCEADRRLPEAAACFRQALEVEPRDAELLFRLGNVHLQQTQFADAEAAYRRCLA